MLVHTSPSDKNGEHPENPVTERDLPEAYLSQVRDEELDAAERRRSRQDLDRRKVLLVGGGGYIGSVLTNTLLRRGYQVRNLDLLLYENHAPIVPFLSDPDYEFVRGDLCQPETLRTALKNVSDVVVLAGLVGDPITKKYPEASNRINSEGISRLIDAMDGKSLNKVIFVSTCSNYGLSPESALADENFELRPLSLYAQAKVEMEQKALALKGAVDFQATVLRFATAFGLSPRMRFDLTVNEFAREMYLNRDLLVFDAHTWRPYCHVVDFSRAVARVLEAPVSRVGFEVFNAGGDVNNFTKQMIVDTVRSLLPDAPVRYQEKGPDPRNYKVSFAKIRERLHFEPRFTVADGVRETVNALRLGMFVDADQRRNFYGNYEIQYS